jgi:hypothetical protein
MITPRKVPFKKELSPQRRKGAKKELRNAVALCAFARDIFPVSILLGQSSVNRPRKGATESTQRNAF